jgi:glycosyltransferase involved in cell wall biosynthesis
MDFPQKAIFHDQFSAVEDHVNGYPRPPEAVSARESDSTPDIRPAASRVSVVIPTLNEEKNILWVLDRLPAGLHEVILVDGCSTDTTIVTAQQARPDIRVVLQQARGKGAALAYGLARVTGDIVVMIDADGSMDPAEIFGLVGALMAGADVVKGSRLAAGGGSMDLTPVRRLGNWGLTAVANCLYRQNWRELCYGYAAFWADVLPLLGVAELCSVSDALVGSPQETDGGARRLEYGHGFEIEAILFCRAAKLGLRIAEVFSFEHERRFGDSNLATWRDGWRVLTALRKERTYSVRSGSLDRTTRTYPVRPYLLEVSSPEQAASSC